MNPVQTLLVSVLPMSQALSGGQAPSGWRGDLQKIREKLDFLWVDSTWMDAIAFQNLSLHDEPILGQALPTMFSKITGAEQRTLATTTQPQLSHTVTGALGTRGTRETRGKPHYPFPITHSPCPLSPLRGGPTIPMPLIPTPWGPHHPHSLKVSQQLLSRLAGVTDSDAVTGLSFPSQNQPVNKLLYSLEQKIINRRHLFTPYLQSKSPDTSEKFSVDTPKNLSYNGGWNTSANQLGGQPSAELSESASPFLSSQQLGQQNWLLGLAERTRRYIHRVESTTGNNLTPQIVGRQGGTFAVSLAQQFSVSLVGQTIALELLMDSMKISRQVAKVQRDKEQVIPQLSDAHHNGSNSVDRQIAVSNSTILTRALDKLSLPKKPKNKLSGIVAPTPTENTSVMLLNDGVSAAINGKGGLPINPQLHSQNLLNNSLGELETSSAVPTASLQPQNVTGRITPTVEIPPLPPLLPPPMVNLPPTSVASAIIREEAKQEISATSEDDLNILAAKIKRILDEEARRYGIDV